MAGIKLAIAPINWSNDDLHELGGDVSLEQCLTEMQAAGFVGTEIGHKFPSSGQAIKSLLQDYKLELASAWHSTFFLSSPFAVEQKRLEERLTVLAEAGAKRINFCECTGTVHGSIEVLLTQRPRMQKADWALFSRALHQAAAICEQYGITIAYHHHMGTVIQEEPEILQLLASTDPQHVGLCFDTGHLSFANCDPLSFWSNVADRVQHIHLKDIRRPVHSKMWDKNSFLQCVKEGVFTVPGDGGIDFAPLLREIVGHGYEGWLVVEAEQDPAVANPLVYARTAYSYLNSILSSTYEKRYATAP